MRTVQRLSELSKVNLWESPVCALCSHRDNSNHFEKNGFNIVRCRNDGLLFVSPRPVDTAPYYDEIYYEGGARGTYESYDAHADEMRPKWTERLMYLERELGTKGRLLDVGAATGRFVKLAHELGWTAIGIEMSEWAVKQGKALGWDIRLGSLPHDGFEKQSFDAVTIWDVIEHLNNPYDVLLAAKDLLRPNGILAISTGAVPHRDPRAVSSWYSPPWHLYYFSTDTIGALLARAGLDVIDVEVASPDSPYALMTVWARASGRQANQRLHGTKSGC